MALEKRFPAAISRCQPKLIDLPVVFLVKPAPADIVDSIIGILFIKRSEIILTCAACTDVENEYTALPQASMNRIQCSLEIAFRQTIIYTIIQTYCHIDLCADGKGAHVSAPKKKIIMRARQSLSGGREHFNRIIDAEQEALSFGKFLEHDAGAAS